MTALIQERMRDFERWTYHRFTLASGKKAWRNGMCGLNAAGKVEPAAAASTLFIIGLFGETVDAAGGDKPVNVNLCTEIEVEWWANGGGITAANVGAMAYALDDNTVTLTSNGCQAGRIWAVSARGVAVEKLPLRPAAGTMAADESEAESEAPPPSQQRPPQPPALPRKKEG